MAGQKGQIQRKLRKNTGRQRAWHSMRIMKSFSLADLMRTTGEKKSDNIRKLVVNLARHGYLTELDGWQRGETGSNKRWSIRINPGPFRPMVCQTCGQPLTAKECQKSPHPCPLPEGEGAMRKMTKEEQANDCK